MAMDATLGGAVKTLLDRLLGELRRKFDRYGVVTGNGVVLNLTGFKYLVRSCALDVDDAAVLRYFSQGVQPGPEQHLKHA
jgi:hypothetical protein